MEEEEEFSELQEVKYIDQEEFENLTIQDDSNRELRIRWLDNFEENEKKWCKLLTRFLEPLPRLGNFRMRVVEKYARCLNAQGCEATIALTGEKKNPVLIFMRIIAPRKAEISANLPLILRDVSETTKAVNFANYIATVMSQLGWSAHECRLFTRNLFPPRLQLLSLFHRNYRSLLELRLSHQRILRAFHNIRNLSTQHKIPFILKFSMKAEVFAFVSHASMMALQVVLEDWNSRIQDEKIIQISHANSIQLSPRLVRGDGFMVLCEALCVSLAMGYKEAQAEIEEFDELLHRKSTFAPAKAKFQLWKLISKFERNRNNANPQGFLISAQRLEEEAELMGEECTVLVETACKIRHLCGDQEEQIIKTLTDTATRHPSLGPKMVELAVKYGVEYEVDVLLQHICDSGEGSEKNGLHPSEPLWLQYVETQVKTVGKFGSVRNTLLKLLKVMFEFLDFDSNRFNAKAWKLMKIVLELSDPSFVKVEWEPRKDWWPTYQKSPSRDGRVLKRKGEKRKNEVLKALEEL